MPVPSYRVPVRVARGTKAALDSGLASLEEGEICYATDENALYVVEGGVLTAAGSSISAASIGDLSDVDTATSAPTDGQVLIWNNVDGEWQPGDSISDVVSDTTPQLGGNLDVNGNQIVSASGGDIEIAPDTTGGLVVRGNSTDGKIKLNCTANTHGVTIQSPPHADAATYSLILPSGAGTAGQVLTSQGGAQLTWEDAGSGGGATSIDDLTDVDTSTTPPTNGQVLEWDGTNWVPGDQTGGGGAVASLDDVGDVAYDTQPVTSYTWSNYDFGGQGAIVDDGEWMKYSTSVTLAAGDDAGTDTNAILLALPTTGTLWHSQDGGLNWTSAAYTNIVDNANVRTVVYFDASTLSTSLPLTLAFTDPTQAVVVDPADGQVLTWVTANSQWEAADLPDAAATRTLLGIGEYADDAAAGTGGVASGAMYYNTTSSDYRLKS